jgi:L-asparaginase / beta-aspartyl-peptidase
MSPALIVHGGSGSIPSDAGARQAACDAAADAAWRFLERGASSLDAVEEAIRRLEDDPVFNAGTGSDLQADGVVRTDASLMADDGRAGAVVQVPGLRNPVRLARYLLEQDAHVMLSGREALGLGLSIGLAPGVLATPAKVGDWQQRVSPAAQRLDYAAMAQSWKRDNVARLGTVGCVALDAEGRLAAGTSTGGTALCYPGRIGDSGVIGAGTYCTRLAGVSMTGLGERMLVRLSAKRLCDLVEGGTAIDRAARAVLAELAQLTPGVAGLIAIDGKGGIVAAHDTAFMVTAERR